MQVHVALCQCVDCQMWHDGTGPPPKFTFGDGSGMCGYVYAVIPTDARDAVGFAEFTDDLDFFDAHDTLDCD